MESPPLRNTETLNTDGFHAGAKNSPKPLEPLISLAPGQAETRTPTSLAAALAGLANALYMEY
jgi:hypothetical protein